MRISDWSSDVCSSDLAHTILAAERFGASPERMATIWEYRSSPHFTDAERAAFDFALAAACVPNAVTPEIQQALRDHWSDDEIVEITGVIALRSEEHTSELQSLMRISYAVFCLKKKKQ